MKTAPLGSMSTTPNFDNHLDKLACWTDPNVLGILLRVNWRDIEPEAGAIDLQYFQNGLELAKKYNKWLVLDINGSEAPAWLYTDEDVPRWTNSQGAYCPYPWDEVLQAHWQQVMTSMGAAFNDKGKVRGISLWCGGTDHETFFARNQADVERLDAIAGGAPGSGAKMWLEAAKAIVGYAITAFPATPLYMITGTAMPDSQQTMTTLAQWFLAKNKPLRGLGCHALQKTYPSLDLFPHTRIESATLQRVMYQLLAPIASPRMKGASLKSVMQNGLKHDAKAIQVYVNDPASDPQALADFNKSVGAVP